MMSHLFGFFFASENVFLKYSSLRWWFVYKTVKPSGHNCSVSQITLQKYFAEYFAKRALRQARRYLNCFFVFMDVFRKHSWRFLKILITITSDFFLWSAKKIKNKHNKICSLRNELCIDHTIFILIFVPEIDFAYNFSVNLYWQE